MSARSSSRGTASRILDVAERLVQTRGFNGFSYADIATELAVTKASLHYHFPTKVALGRAVIARYHEVFARLLREIDAEPASCNQSNREGKASHPARGPRRRRQPCLQRSSRSPSRTTCRSTCPATAENVVILVPDVAKRFADSASVNKVLSSFIARSGKKRSRA